jgi:hypothetical protein
MDFNQKQQRRPALRASSVSQLGRESEQQERAHSMCCSAQLGCESRRRWLSKHAGWRRDLLRDSGRLGCGASVAKRTSAIIGASAFRSKLTRLNGKGRVSAQFLHSVSVCFAGRRSTPGTAFYWAVGFRRTKLDSNNSLHCF